MNIARQSIRALGVCLIALAAFWTAGLALAGPTGAHVVRGKATIELVGDTWTIRASNRSIIAFDRFDVASGQTVRFILPSKNARVMGRVEGGQVSVIEGVLDCNGRLVLINPAGITIAPGAIVSAGAFTACAGRLSDADFLRGVNAFRDVTGSVINQGTIQAEQSVVLVGRLVENAGSIVCPQGLVVLASGQDVFISSGQGNIVTRIDAAKLPAAGASAEAPSAPRIGARDACSLAVHNTGRVQAKEIVADAGPAGTAQISGKFDASSAAGRGGTIIITGEAVNLVGVLLDASGAIGGGSIAVGRSAQSATLSNVTNMDAGSVLVADATGVGNGGRIALWGDTASIAGSLAARGAGNGAGGFVETSGGVLTVASVPDTSSPSGRCGTWLIDPTNILITDNGLSPLHLDDGTATFESAPGQSVVYAESIAAAFALVDAVVIRTGAGPGKGDITWESRLPFDVSTWGGHSKQIVLIADNDIIFKEKPADWGTLQGLRLTLVPNADHRGGGTTVIELLSEFHPKQVRGNADVWRTRPMPVEPDSPLEVAVVRAESSNITGVNNAEAEKYFAMGDYSRAKDKYQQGLPTPQATTGPASQPASAPSIRSSDRVILAVPTLVGP